MSANWLDEVEREALARGAEQAAKDENPAYRAIIAGRRHADHERGVRLGWWDADGTPIPQPDDEEDEDDESSD